MLQTKMKILIESASKLNNCNEGNNLTEENTIILFNMVNKFVRAINSNEPYNVGMKANHIKACLDNIDVKTQNNLNCKKNFIDQFNEICRAYVDLVLYGNIFDLEKGILNLHKRLTLINGLQFINIKHIIDKLIKYFSKFTFTEYDRRKILI